MEGERYGCKERDGWNERTATEREMMERRRDEGVNESVEEEEEEQTYLQYRGEKNCEQKQTTQL